MNRRWSRALLTAAALGAAAGVLTRSAAVAVLVACVALGLLKPRRQAAQAAHEPLPRALAAWPSQRAGEGQEGSRPPHQAQRRPADQRKNTAGNPTGTSVTCKRVTHERQEWVSSRTGRLYDVLSPNGVMGARPGDRGRVTLSSTGWRIVPEQDPAQQDPPPSTAKPGVKR